MWNSGNWFIFYNSLHMSENIWELGKWSRIILVFYWSGKFLKHSPQIKLLCSSCSVNSLAVPPQVSCIGQMLCAVVADTRANAKRGAAAVKISYEDLPDPVFTVEVNTLTLTLKFTWMPHLLMVFFLSHCDRRPSKSPLSSSRWECFRGEM